MNFRILPRADLVEFAKNAAAAIANGKVSGFLPAQNTALSTAISNSADFLDDADKKAVASMAQARADIAIAQGGRRDLLNLLSGGKFGMRGVQASADEYAAVGFDPPADPANITTPQTPSKLAATGYSNGVNELRFKGNNDPGKVIYIIEATTGDDAGYAMIGSSKKQSFKHRGVTPGQHYEYRVQAQATRGMVSEWSNTAAVYDRS